MSAAEVTALGGIIVAIITAAGVWVGRKVDAKATAAQTARLREIEQQKVDRERFESIMEHQGRMLADAMERSTQLERDVRELNKDRSAQADEIRNLRHDLDEEREARQESDTRARTLQRRVDQLENVIRREGIPLPAPLPEPNPPGISL